MATGGGARAWQFLRRNEAFREAYAARPDTAPVLEDAPFALRRQSAFERGLGRFGLDGAEDPFDEAGPLSPFWSVAPMLEVVPVRLDGWTLAGLAQRAGTALGGLRLAGGALILKLERGGRAQQLRIAEGGAFDPVRDGIRVALDVAPGLPGGHAAVGRLWRLLRVPAPPTGRCRGPGMRSCCGRSTWNGPACRSPRSRRRCGARTRSPAAGTTRTRIATGSAGAWSACTTSSTRAT